MPQRCVMEYASQITVGLAVAHDKGVVHRDLMPDNVFFCRDRRGKVLDFGLAKLARADAAAASEGATVTGSPHTTPGMVLGTVGNMSPEQVRGKDLDARTDLFSFGVVLYEMATGTLPLRGGTSGVIFKAILDGTPTSASARLDEKSTAVPEIQDGEGAMISKQNLSAASIRSLLAVLYAVVLVLGDTLVYWQTPASTQAPSSAAQAPKIPDDQFDSLVALGAFLACNLSRGRAER